MVKLFEDVQYSRAESMENVFKKTSDINSKLIKISIFELFVVVLAGVLQFWALREFLINKQCS